MSNLLALTWRCLLALALVFNPVAGVGMAYAASGTPDTKAMATKAKADMPPCHHMAMPISKAPAQPSPERGHDCGKTCQFAACCTAAALSVPTLLVARLTGAQAPPMRDVLEAAAPPPARLIRPPIA
jgi:hypothetical protein